MCVTCASMCGYAQKTVGAYGGLRHVPLELELQEMVSHVTCMPGIELRFSARAVWLLHHGPPLQPCCFFTNFCALFYNVCEDLPECMYVHYMHAGRLGLLS